jgi:tetratricopeptide (TPR) repeat protein
VTIAILLLAFNLADWWRDSNSHAANAKGVDAFSKKRYAEAVKAFSKEKASPQAAFNLGTAQIAAGSREQGSHTLNKALQDPKLRADAWFNRGSSALASKSYDYAIHDLTEALKANPRDAAAKRNLEIAIARKRQSQQQAGGSDKNKKGSSPAPQPEPSPNGRQQEKGDPNAEALLRSVQQQEQEELARMHRVRPDRARIGW